MTNQEKPFPQMSNEEPLPPKPSVSPEGFLNLDEEQLEAVTGGGNCASCQRNIPANVIRTPAGKTARTHVDALRAWEREHPTPEAMQNWSWFPKRIEHNGREYWVKDPIPS